MNLFQDNAAAISFVQSAAIFNTGEASSGQMFAVAEGQIDIQLNNHSVETIGPGGIFGEMGLIDHQPRSAQAVAKTAAKLVAIDAPIQFFSCSKIPSSRSRSCE